MKGIKILERISLAIPTMLAIAIFVFILMRIMPGDPVDKMMGKSGNVSIEEVQALEIEFHLDLPLFEQLKIFINGILHGDLGLSFQERRPVWDIIIERFPATIELALGALIFSLIVAIPIGVISAVKQNSLIDRLGMAFAFLGISAPAFWLGIIFIIIFAVNFNILPVYLSLIHISEPTRLGMIS